VNYQKVADKGGYTIGSAGVLYRKALKKLFEINGESLASSPAGTKSPATSASPRTAATRGRGGAGRGARGVKGMTTESGSPISALKKPYNISDDGQSDANDLLPSPSMGTLDNTARAKRQKKTVAQATWPTIKYVTPFSLSSLFISFLRMLFWYFFFFWVRLMLWSFC
jgi:hypothetical protein